MQKDLKLILDSFLSGAAIQPIVLTDELLIEAVNHLNGSNHETTDDLRGDIKGNVFVFATEENSIKIEMTRQVKEKSALRSQFGFNIFVIKEIDKLTLQAANSLLKVLEDVPDRTLFLLTTKSKENMLETIRSRVLIFGSNELNFDIPEETKALIDDFVKGKGAEFLMKILLTEKFNRSESIGTLEYLLESLSKNRKLTAGIADEIIAGIGAIHNTNANPRGIIDRIIFRLTRPG